MIDAEGWSAGVGYQAVLGVSDVNRLGYAMTYIHLAEDPARMSATAPTPT